MTSAETARVAEIAGSLTMAQRTAVTTQIGEQWAVRAGNGHGHTRVLYFLGLAEMRRAPNAHPHQLTASRRVGVEHRLTLLGLAVRHLLATAQEREG